MKKEENILFVKPVKKYAIPKYPTQKYAENNPELLRKLPSRWQKNAAVIAAIGLLGTITLTSCNIADNSSGSDSEKLMNVAPVFVHGSGTGSIGCDMIAPAVFLSEQEAIAIIKGELTSAGLEFNAVPPEYTATSNKGKPLSEYSWENQNYVLGDGNIGLELYDDKKDIAVTFISMEEAGVRYVDKDGNETMWSSVTSYYPRDLAELTVEDFSQQNSGITAGIFYDPGTDWESEEHKQILDEYNNSEKEWEEKIEQYENDTRALLEKDLREQVRDFIEWLQGQGII